MSVAFSSESGSVAPDLTPIQDQAARQDGAVLVLAGAGTGKTRTLTGAVIYRIRELQVPPHRILAVTFTNKAAGEMAARIRAALEGEQAPGWIGTFHGLAARQLRSEPEIAGLRAGFDIVDADDSRRLIKRTLKALNLDDRDEGEGAGRNPVKQMANRIAELKDNLMVFAEAPAHFEGLIRDADRTGLPIDAEGLRNTARVYAEYQRRLTEANAADFGDLLMATARALRSDPVFRERWSTRFDCVLADEYQDVNYAQYVWLRYLAQDHGRIFVVGDDDQAVFGWRGSDIAYIRRFTRDFPEAETFRLEENFRSTGCILAAANAVIAKDPERLGKTLFTRKPAGDPIEIVCFRDGAEEALGIAVEIATRHGQGQGYDEFAVLYRANYLSREIEEAQMRARIPYVIVGDVGFYQRAEVKDALALLRLAINPDDRQSDEAFRRVVNTPARGFGPKAMQLLEDDAAFRGISLLRALETAPLPPKARSAGFAFADAVRQVALGQHHTVAETLSLLADTTGYRAMLRESRAESNEDRLANLHELITIAGAFHNARELLDHAALATNRDSEDEAGRVRLMSLHKAKGLEFGHVFLPAWEEGVFPSPYADPAEERRLAYVALTRGMRRVTISFAEWRRAPKDPNPFIGDIPEKLRVWGWLRGNDANRGEPHHDPLPSSHQAVQGSVAPARSRAAHALDPPADAMARKKP